MINRLVQLKNQNAQLRSDVVDLKCRSMKNKLVFVGLARYSKEENSEVVLRDFLYHELGMEDDIKCVSSSKMKEMYYKYRYITHTGQIRSNINQL